MVATPPLCLCGFKCLVMYVPYRIESIKQKFQGIRAEMEREARKAQKIEEKIRILCLGHWTRDEKTQSQSHALWTELQQSKIDLESYLELQR